MKKLSALLLFVPILLWTCKKDEEEPITGDETPSAQEEALFQAHSGTLEILDAFYEQAEVNQTEPFSTLEYALTEAQEYPGVINAYITDSAYLWMEWEGGITHFIWLNYLDENDQPIYRGSPKRSFGMTTYQRSNANCTNPIPNEKILFWSPAYSEFNLEDNRNSVLQSFNESSIEFEITQIIDENCTPASLSNIDEYGLVIFDTHGTEKGTMTGVKATFENYVPSNTTTFRNEVLSQIGQSHYNMWQNGQLAMGHRAQVRTFSTFWYDPPEEVEDEYNTTFHWFLTESFINSLPSLDETVVFNNSCFSGMIAATNETPNPIANMYLAKEPIAYYGYAKLDGTSAAVTDNFAQEISISFSSRIAQSDSTGEAYFDDSGLSQVDPNLSFGPNPIYLYFVHYGSDDYCYEDCNSSPFTDSRDGRQYETVCINGTRWMAEDLKWAGAGICQLNEPANCENFGRLYNQDEILNGQDQANEPIQGICPNGWRLPTQLDYESLIEYCGGDENAPYNFLSATDWPENAGTTDPYGFNLKPTGGVYRNILYDDWEWFGLNNGGEIGLWSSTGSEACTDTDCAWGIQLRVNNVGGSSMQTGLWLGSPENGFYYMACRCVEE